MKKYFLIGIIMAIVPNICFGASARFTQLAREKERKMAELEKCMGSTKGLKIAGISTLGLSAVGVAANVVEAKKIKDYDSSIESTQQQIEKTKTEINKKTDELSKRNRETESSTPANENQNEFTGAWKDFYDLCYVIPVSGDISLDRSGEACSGLNKGGWVLNGTNGNSVCKTEGNYSICTCNVDNKSTTIEVHNSQDDCLDECTVACITEFNSSKLAGPYNLKTPSNQNQTQAQDTTCGNLGQKECKTNYKICEKDGQTKDCTGDMLPRYATSGHCVSAGRKDYKICTATECDDKHTLNQGHCNTKKNTRR